MSVTAARRAYRARPEVRAKEAAGQRARYRADPQKYIAMQRKHYRRHRRRLIDKQLAKHKTPAGRAKIRAYRARPEVRARLAEQRRRYAARNRASQVAWRRAHPDHVAGFYARRRAIEKGAPGTHTTNEWLAKRAALGEVCFYCGCDVRLDRDHMLPLKRGGSDYIENIVPACRSCNSSKKNMTTAEFVRLRVAQHRAGTGRAFQSPSA